MARLYACAMTISEQLQFSVLTAPVACVDRRALSQAWYSALYGSRMAAPPRANVAPTATATQAAAGNARARLNDDSTTMRASAVCAARGNQAERTRGEPMERRAARSPLARKIERAFAQPRNAAHKTSFTFDGDYGRVHMVLHTHGAQLKLVAICPPKARPAVAAALAQARYALALRGIDLDAQMHGPRAC